MPNRLAVSTSPYLLQHADNPVDWMEWGEEAFSRARERNVPILLSIGYAACHWCHVMAHESFEDEGVAADLTAGFVAVKVDREERPDVDAVYMRATTAMTGHGGWPMTCLLTPDGDPFWCGTYLPREQFRTLLANAGEAWRTQESEVRASGVRIRQALAEDAGDTPDAVATTSLLAGDDSVGALSTVLADAVPTLAREFDAAHGGFGGAPKFPPSMVLTFLLRHASRTGDADAARMAGDTLRALARSGTYDQLEGGFARYAVDAAWVVPHFEKMLYDNALLLQAFTEWWALPGVSDADRALGERVVRETVAFLLTRMRTPEGGFASSLDADTDGVEGATYVWTLDHLRRVLGEVDGDRAAELLRVTASGTFEHGASTLQLPGAPLVGDDATWWTSVRERLATARDDRPQPGRDDKVVTAWNGLAVAALAQAGVRFGEPTWTEAAAEAADLLLRVHVVDGRLRRASRDGVAGSARAVAEDLGDLAVGLLALHGATAQPRWLEAARTLVEEATRHYGADADPADHTPGPSTAFHDNAADVDDLPVRPATRGDNAEPCGQSALALALLRLGVAAGDAALLTRGRAALAPMATLMARAPRFAGWALTAAEEAVAGPVQVVLAVPADTTGPSVTSHPLLDAARHAPPGTLVLTGPGDAPGVPLLTGRGPLDGAPAAYVCRGTVCDLPVTDPEALTASLSEHRHRMEL